MKKLKNAITDVPGILVGQVQDLTGLTGCTVILCEQAATGGVDQRGGAPGTRETDLLNPVNLVDKVNAIMLAGGSAFGLDAAAGVMRYLQEHKTGFNAGSIRVPIVPAAILFDLGIGDPLAHPDADMGYQACQVASSEAPAQGNFGAGCGASVGKLFGMGQAMKSGIGTASVNIGGGVIVGAIVAVNAFGDVVDPHSGQILAGTRSTQVGPLKLGNSGYFANTLNMLKTLPGRTVMGLATRSNTVIGVVASNARFDKAATCKVAQMAQDGLARCIRPAHTMLDGDTIFALSTGKKRADVSTVGAWAAEVLAQAILSAIRAAQSAGGLPALRAE
ncbi:MAG: peptidase S58 [Chloroflexi bacterium GWB2_49_20]|nr:MAG: peptidase S58 [Chloroflexi bacterium GWB2_49_20]OGN80486.1 MAG: peptidase S58 [Chloroflexi bacterium GWC2_49_37]OGN83321.1 MAG: peptidase S58 [Chloroflexi bacterium GWD2_49_16]HCC78191.1 peptidase S58 [Anaerolineae bacterium]